MPTKTYRQLREYKNKMEANCNYKKQLKILEDEIIHLSRIDETDTNKFYFIKNFSRYLKTKIERTQ